MRVEIVNVGTGAPADNTVTFSNSIPPNSWLHLPATPFVFSQGVVPSALSFSYIDPANTSDSVEFSEDGGATFTYVPTPAADGAAVNVTNIRITPTGKMNCANAGSTPSFSFDYELLVP